MDTRKFLPIEACLRDIVNVVGRVMGKIVAAYPERKAFAAAHRAGALEFRQLATTLETAPNEPVEMPLTGGSIATYSSMLDLVNKHVLGPVAALRQKSAPDAEVKEALIRGLHEIADILDQDAIKIENES